MPDEVVPQSLKIAARRGFLRAMASGYKATLSAGLPSAAVILAAFKGDGWGIASITVALAVLTPLIAGAARYFEVIANGLPEEYESVAVSQQMHTPLTRRQLREARGQG